MQKNDLPLPICQNAIVCEKAILDAVTGAHTLVSIFDEWAVPAFPTQIPSFWVFMQLDDGIGEHALVVEVRDATDRVISKTDAARIDFRPHGRGYRFNVRMQICAPIVVEPGKLAIFGSL